MLIEFVDQTLRDGPQSLYDEGTMPLSMQLQLAPLQDALQFRAADEHGGARFATLVNQGGNPWDYIRNVVALSPHQLRRTGIRPGFLGLMQTSDDVVDLYMHVLARAGVHSFWIFDVFYRLDMLHRFGETAKAAGAEAVMSIMWTLSPYHTDEFFASVAREYASWDCTDGIFIEDTAGVMTPERSASLVTAIRQVTDIPIELHYHNTVGLAELSYISGMAAGADTLHTACRPLANGGSLPSTEAMLRVAKDLGHETRLEERHLKEYSGLANSLANVHSLPIGSPSEYDIRVYDHQVPGGMMQSLRRQLNEVGLGIDKLDDVLEEIGRVRVEFGSPPMATPISQLIGTQSVLNVVTGERYSAIPDEVASYLSGLLGDPLGPIDENVRDRVLGSERAERLRRESEERSSRTVADFRRQHGELLTDEELLIRIFAARPSTVRSSAITTKKAGINMAAIRNVINSLIELGLDDVQLEGPGVHVRVNRKGHSV